MPNVMPLGRDAAFCEVFCGPHAVHTCKSMYTFANDYVFMVMQCSVFTAIVSSCYQRANKITNFFVTESLFSWINNRFISGVLPKSALALANLDQISGSTYMKHLLWIKYFFCIYVVYEDFQTKQFLNQSKNCGVGQKRRVFGEVQKNRGQEMFGGQELQTIPKNSQPDFPLATHSHYILLSTLSYMTF